MKKWLAMLLMICLLTGAFCLSFAEDAASTLAALTVIGNDLNDQLDLGAERIYWQYITETDDPTVTLLAVATTNNSRTIVVAGGDLIPDDQLKVLPIRTKGSSKRTTVPETIGDTITIDENTVARVYDGNLADGTVMIGAKDAWVWFVDDVIQSGTACENGSKWVTFGCKYMYNKSTNELRKKNLHSYKLTGGYPAGCTSFGLASYECARCGQEYSTLRSPLGHRPVTYPGSGTFCTRCKQKLY